MVEKLYKLPRPISRDYSFPKSLYCWKQAKFHTRISKFSFEAFILTVELNQDTSTLLQMHYFINLVQEPRLNLSQVAEIMDIL